MVGRKVWLIDKYKEPEKCIYSNKLLYRTRKKAQRAASKYTNKYKTKATVYQCSFCGYWHLTTHAK